MPAAGHGSNALIQDLTPRLGGVAERDHVAVGHRVLLAFEAQLAVLAAGRERSPPEQILAAYPYLEAADIDEALHYAASLAEDETVELAG